MLVEQLNMADTWMVEIDFPNYIDISTWAKDLWQRGRTPTGRG